VVGPCEHGNEPFGSLKDVVFLDYEFLLASQELRSMELVHHSSILGKDICIFNILQIRTVFTTFRS
jgi:hypothetical protein